MRNREEKSGIGRHEAAQSRWSVLGASPTDRLARRHFIGHALRRLTPSTHLIASAPMDRRRASSGSRTSTKRLWNTSIGKAFSIASFADPVYAVATDVFGLIRTDACADFRHQRIVL
jgi:hypothetical protein